MKKYSYLLLLALPIFTAVSCKQSSREEAQEQFRERRQVIAERNQTQAEAMPPAEPATATIAPAAETEETPPSTPATTAGDKVIGVKDGDTIELLINGQPVTVRLFGVDTPEKKQAFGEKAKQFTSDLVFGKTVRLIEHNKDRYGRTVGTIMLQDGRSLNEELVKNGYAWHYAAYSNDKKLANLEADARRFQRGLWQDANPTAPWDYRKEKRGGSSASQASTPTTPVPAGATKRRVYLCNSKNSEVYHLTQTCHVLKRCKQEIIAVTEATAIREYERRPDKNCSNI